MKISEAVANLESIKRAVGDVDLTVLFKCGERPVTVKIIIPVCGESCDGHNVIKAAGWHAEILA